MKNFLRILVLTISILIVSVPVFASDTMLINSYFDSLYDTTIANGVVADSIKVQLDGEIVDFTDENGFKVEPQIINDRTMVPMRKIFEVFGANVEWIGETRTIKANTEDLEIGLQIDNKLATVKNKSGEVTEITLDSAPVIVNDRTLVPVRFIAESLNKKVDWDGTKRIVIIKDNKMIFETRDITINKSYTDNRYIDCVYPVITSIKEEEFGDYIKEYINTKILEEINGYISEIEYLISKDTTSNKLYKYVVTYDKYVCDKYASLIIDQVYETGGIRSNKWKSIYNFDLEAEQIIYLKDLFEKDVNYVEAIVNEINKQANQKNIKLMNSAGLTGIPVKQKFYIKDKKLFIYFEPSEIATAVLDEFEFEMPFEMNSKGYFDINSEEDIVLPTNKNDKETNKKRFVVSNFNEFQLKMDELENLLKQTMLEVRDDERLRGNQRTESQIYNYLARGGVNVLDYTEEGMSKWLTWGDSTNIACTKINEEYALEIFGEELPVIKVNTSKKNNEEVAFFVSPWGDVFCWPPYEHNGKCYVNTSTLVTAENGKHITAKVATEKNKINLVFCNPNTGKRWVFDCFKRKKCGT